ncbi:hypothetical protein ABZX30_16370 [Streptomyces sp. NPDC004542]|uniref:hypothetical protein n=1 Tax=Streptomyces sp. NPDC004542 TaxID=3154281 RepID=UPI0033A29BE0
MTSTMTTTQRTEVQIRRRSVRALKVYWPVSRQTLALAAAGDVEVLRREESLAGLLRVVETSPCLGDFGMYTDVFEVGIGAEGFTTGRGAAPTLGAVGEQTLSPTLTVTTYIDASVPEDELSHALSRIVAAHPWEVPVVELSAPVELVTRG